MVPGFGGPLRIEFEEAIYDVTGAGEQAATVFRAEGARKRSHVEVAQL